MLAENILSRTISLVGFTKTDRGYQFFKQYDELIELIEPMATIAENKRR
jgi:hypothetical protein